MKKTKLDIKSIVSIALAIILLLLSVPALSALKFGDFATGHRHDFSVGSGGLTSNEQQVCVFCHTPHAANTDGPDPDWKPTLFNRDAPTGGPYPTYGGATAAQGSKIYQEQHTTYNSAYAGYPNGSTRLCLSCHDGVSSVGAILNLGSAIPLTMAYDNLTDYNAAAISDNTAGMIVDLAVTHPVSFTYDSNLLTALGGSYQAIPAGSKVVLDNVERMQCTTCHDPHIDTRLDPYYLPFWRTWVPGQVTAIDADADMALVCDACHTVDKTTYNSHTM